MKLLKRGMMKRWGLHQEQENSILRANLDDLRTEWQDAMTEREIFRSKCLSDKEKWPRNYQDNAAPYNEKVEQAYTEYNSLKLQIEKYKASIFRYATGDLSTMMLEQENGEEQLRTNYYNERY